MHSAGQFYSLVITWRICWP